MMTYERRGLRLQERFKKYACGNSYTFKRMLSVHKDPGVVAAGGGSLI